MKKVNLPIFVVIILITTIIISGCDGFAPNNNPNQEYDRENTELAGLKIIPATLKMKVNQTKIFELQAYNSDKRLIEMDIDKFEKWVAMYQCVGCGTVWSISPTRNSFTTKFTPYKAGQYTVSAKYDGIWVQIIVKAE